MAFWYLEDLASIADRPRAWRGGEKREGEKGDSFEGSPTLEDHVNGRSAVRGARRPELQRLEEVVEVQLNAVVLVDLLRQTSGLTTSGGGGESGARGNGRSVGRARGMGAREGLELLLRVESWATRGERSDGQSHRAVVGKDTGRELIRHSAMCRLSGKRRKENISDGDGGFAKCMGKDLHYAECHFNDFWIHDKYSTQSA